MKKTTRRERAELIGGTLFVFCAGMEAEVWRVHRNDLTTYLSVQQGDRSWLSDADLRQQFARPSRNATPDRRMLNDPQKMLKLLSRSSAIREALWSDANWSENVGRCAAPEIVGRTVTISREQAVAALNSAERLLRGAGRLRHADEIVALRDPLMHHAERSGQRQAASTAVDPYHGMSMLERFFASTAEPEREDLAQAQTAAVDPSHGKSMVELFYAAADDWSAKTSLESNPRPCKRLRICFVAPGSHVRSLLYDALRQVEEPFPDRQSWVRFQVRTTYHLRRMAEEVAQGAMSVAGAHGYVRGSEIDRLYRDLTGGIVMAWKTDELRHSLGLSALGQEITIVGPAGT